MAPEVIRHEPYSEKADVWSYGVVLWELLTRRIPFEGMEPLSVAYHIGSGKLTLPTEMRGIPPAFKHLMARCWDTNPKRRPAFKEILRILESLPPTEFAEIPADWFVEKQGLWRTEIQKYFMLGDSYMKKQQVQLLDSRELTSESSDAAATSKDPAPLSRSPSRSKSISTSHLQWRRDPMTI